MVGLAGSTNTPILLLVSETAMEVMSVNSIAIENRSLDFFFATIMFGFSHAQEPSLTK